MNKSGKGRIAVLGAGIMGSCAALALARRGKDVTLFDREAKAVDRASRWNEGKIHLGYLYGADRSLATARHVLPGTLLFSSILSELTARDISSFATKDDDLYFVHRNSVTEPDQLQSVFTGVSGLVRDHPNSNRYLVDVSGAKERRLSSIELERLCDTSQIVAAFSVPERSVNTRTIADLLVKTLAAEPRIECRFQTEVTRVTARSNSNHAWRVDTAGGEGEDFDIVVNALWNGRLKIDETAGLKPIFEWSNRYRLALFVRTSRDVNANCGLVAVGPFGDIKSYSPRDFYLSWYPAGLVLQSTDLDPRDPRPIELAQKNAIILEVKRKLGGMLAMVPPILDSAETIECNGGFVYARGTGSIGDPISTLHRRDLFGVEQWGSYFSIDTGKYSTAPYLADQLAKVICGE